MNEEIDEQDFCQRDFTTTTDWELFIAHLEKIIHEWKLPEVKKGPQLKRGELSEGEWERTTEKITFADFEFNITRHNLKQKPLEDVTSPVEEETEEGRSQALDDILSLDNDFPPQMEYDFGDGSSHPHPLARWYGLRDFVVVAPARNSISAESRVKILLSSIYMAVNNCGCQIPVFIQIHEVRQHYYMGVCEGKGVRSEFVMVHLKRTPPRYKHLTGLLDLFKSKVTSALPLEPVSVAVRFTYVLLDWTSNNTWTQEPPDFDFLQGESLGVAELGKLPFGATFDPVRKIRTGTGNRTQDLSALRAERSFQLSYAGTRSTREVRPAPWIVSRHSSVGKSSQRTELRGPGFDSRELHLFATWPHVMENVMVDSESYSDFEPSQAPQWSVRVKMVEQPACLLSEYLSEFIQLCKNSKSMQDLLGDMVQRGNSAGTNLSTPLSVLTDSRVPTISKVIKKAKGSRQSSNQEEGPIADNQLMPILYFLFPDAEDEPKSPYPEVLGNHSTCDNRQMEDLSTGLKSAPVDGLVWRLAVVMSHVVHTLGGVRAAAHLWYEFTQEMRFRWEKGITVPG
ncbi:hypothetical protein ANN_18632 [Periplaneta americana]|uniref:Rab3 GTPase-activating protein catalytic subunit n=1 Tax=Periplaneta americana TaxID=6978 RepID=A0ABQ8SPZ5_PERAM|nr:hypothetical protein ANN_18632 [Periplaneta americana]